LLRKAAHVAVFFVLGLLLTNALRMTLITLKNRHVCAIAGALCGIIAICCEFSKAFIPGRHCQWDEAVIDIAAASTGTLLFFAVIYFKSVRYISGQKKRPA
jgi:VanZ family protein